MPQAREYSLTTSTRWLIFARTAGFVFTTAIAFVLVRQLPQEDFGLYKQISLATGTAAAMLPLGVSMFGKATRIHIGDAGLLNMRSFLPHYSPPRRADPFGQRGRP